MKDKNFKVGDKVEFTHNGKKRTGKIVEIDSSGCLVYSKGMKGHNAIVSKKGKRSTNEYWWFDNGSLKLINDETIVIYHKDQEVIALDKSTGKKAVAKCCPSDEFDFITGAKLAFERLTGKPEEKEAEYKKGDLFQVKPNLDEFGNIPPFIMTRMSENKGCLLTLKNITESGNFKMSDEFVYRKEWLNPIKEVQRVAEPGEFVKIINEDTVPGDDYKVGDILKIISRKRCTEKQSRYAEGNIGSTARILNKEEYVVLECYEDSQFVKKFDDEIKAGDMVEVVSAGANYSSYEMWSGLKGYESHYVLGKSPVKGKEYKCINIAKHDRTGKMIALIQDQDTTQVFIIGVYGIKKA